MLNQTFVGLLQVQNGERDVGMAGEGGGGSEADCLTIGMTGRLWKEGWDPAWGALVKGGDNCLRKSAPEGEGKGETGPGPGRGWGWGYCSNRDATLDSACKYMTAAVSPRMVRPKL